MGKTQRKSIYIDNRKLTIAKSTQLKGSDIWSGYVRTALPGAITQVSALWHVPAVSDNPPGNDRDANVLIWVGMDGIDSAASTLIQIGTGADYKTPDGSLRYFAWYEVLPAIQRIVILPTDQYPVRPGDEITAEIIQLTGTSMYMALNNYTQNWRFSVPAIDYSGPRQTADFIVERGSIPPNIIFPLADYGQVQFYRCHINKKLARFNASERLFMVTTDGKTILSAPSLPMPPNASTFIVSQPPKSQRTRTVKMISKRIGNSTLSVPIMKTKG